MPIIQFKNSYQPGITKFLDFVHHLVFLRTQRSGNWVSVFR
jgi:hypothetical protein